ncbi:2807_t:CDS:2, partial [Gigaspora rosea]
IAPGNLNEKLRNIALKISEQSGVTSWRTEIIGVVLLVDSLSSLFGIDDGVIG